MPSLVSGPGRDLIPSRDEDLLSFATNFAFQWANVPEEAGLTFPLASEITDVVQEFETALLLASNPASRTVPNVAAKNVRRAALVSLLRIAARNCQSSFRAGLLTAAQLALFGLRQADPPSPILAPTDAPLIDVVSVGVDTVTLRVNQVVNGQAVTLRRFPSGVVGVEWTFTSGTTSRVVSVNRVNVSADTTDFANGAIVRVCGRYYTRRGLVGPVSQEVTFPALRGGA